MTAREQIALALDEAGFVSAEDGILDSIKSGFKKLMGGGSKGGSSQSSGGGDGDSISEHDRKYHKGGFDPSRDTCKWREDKIKEGGDPAIYNAATAQVPNGGVATGSSNGVPVGGGEGNGASVTLANGEQLNIVDGILRVPALGNIEVPVDPQNAVGMAELIDQLKIAANSLNMTDEQKATYEAVLEHLKANLKGETAEVGQQNGEGDGREATQEGAETGNESGTEANGSQAAVEGESQQNGEKEDKSLIPPTEEMRDNLQMYDKDGNIVQFKTQEEYDAELVERNDRRIKAEVDAQIKAIFDRIDAEYAQYEKKDGGEYQSQFDAVNGAILDAELEFTEAEGVDILDSEQAKDEWVKYKEAMQNRQFDKARKHRDKFNEIKARVLEEQSQKKNDEKFTIPESRDMGDGKPLDKNALDKPRDITPDMDSVMEDGDKLTDVLNTNRFAKDLLDIKELEDITAGPTVSKYTFSIGDNHGNLQKFTGSGNILSDNNILSAINGALGLSPKDELNPRSAIVYLDSDKVVVEIPNKERKTVGLTNLLDNEGFREKFEKRKKEGKATCPISICADDGERVLTWDMDEDPHIGFAGTTGAGKSVAFKSAIRSLMALFGPDELGFVLADPKAVEFSEFNGAKHLELPVATSQEEIRSMVKNVLAESLRRQEIIAKTPGCQNIAEYNKKFPDKKMKRIVLGIDELNALVSTLGEDFRDNVLAKLMNTSRFTGIHVMWGTQTPSKATLGAQIVNATGARVGLKCADGYQSQQILGQGHTEAVDLMKRGDGYYVSESQGSVRTRMQAPFSPKDEQERIIMSEKGEPLPSRSEGGGEGASASGAQASTSTSGGTSEVASKGSSGDGNGEGGKTGEGKKQTAKKTETLAERNARKKKEAAEAHAKEEAEIQDKITKFSSMTPEERVAEYDKEMNREIARAVAEAQAHEGRALSYGDIAVIAKPIQEHYAMLKQNEMAGTESESPKVSANEMAYQTADAEYRKNPTLENRRKAVEAEKNIALEKATTASESYQVEKKYNSILKQIDADISEAAEADKQRKADADAKKQKEAEKKMATYQPMVEAYNATKSDEGNTDEANLKYLDALKKHKLALLDAKNLSPDEDAEQRRAIRAEYDKNSAPYKKNIEAKQAAVQKEKEHKEREEAAKQKQAEAETQRKAKEEERAKAQAEKDKAAKAKADEEAKHKEEAEKKEKRKADARTAYEKEPSAANKQAIVEIDAEEALERAKAKKYKSESERAEAIKRVQEENADRIGVAQRDAKAESLSKTFAEKKDLIDKVSSSKAISELSGEEKKELTNLRKEFAANERDKAKHDIEKMRKSGKHKDGSPYTDKDYARDIRRIDMWTSRATNYADQNAQYSNAFHPPTFDHAPTAKELLQEEVDGAEYRIAEDSGFAVVEENKTAKERVLEQLSLAFGEV